MIKADSWALTFSQDPSYKCVHQPQVLVYCFALQHLDLVKTQRQRKRKKPCFIVVHWGVPQSNLCLNSGTWWTQLSLLNTGWTRAAWATDCKQTSRQIRAVHTPWFLIKAGPVRFSLSLRIKHQNQMINRLPSTLTMLSDLFGVWSGWRMCAAEKSFVNTQGPLISVLSFPSKL